MSSGLDRLVMGVLLCLALITFGCKKEAPAAVGVNGDVVVALGPGDVNADGTIKDQGLEKIRQAPSNQALTVAVARMGLSDAGLEQLAQFKNLRHVSSSAGRMTPAGIAKLKKAVPEAEIGR
jgi:hypothetical protein